MKSLRTPDECFADIPDYPFEPNYVEISDGEGGTLRVHYVDEGPRDANPIVLMHGEPTWSFLYRKMIPPLAAAGYRVIAIDLVGFGKSDKPSERSDYLFVRHVDWIDQVFTKLNLSNATFFGQDWGSIVGLTVVMKHAESFDRIVIANGGLPDPRKASVIAEAMQTSANPKAFLMWQKMVAATDDLDAAMCVRGAGDDGTAIPGIHYVPLSAEDAAAYRAPFPDRTFQGGMLAFPALANTGREGDDIMAAWMQAWDVLDHWHKPFLCLYGKQDPVLGWYDIVFKQTVPGAAGQPHQVFEDAGHFIQEEKADQLAAAVLAFIAAS
jgi:haloalkane dehalogenase